ncbi:MAG: hypothetical protein M5U07_11245 [Xanthobacteraceae bacterium]|nr:hypothetical protein [Xanthobacteraceae bacterium]
MFDLGSAVGPYGQAQRARRRLLGVFSTPGDTRADWVATGRALAAVLHVVTMHGLVNAFLNQPIEVTTIRPKLAELGCPGRTPQLLSGFGYLKEGIAMPPHAAPPARRSAHRRLKRQRPPHRREAFAFGCG